MTDYRNGVRAAAALGVTPCWLAFGCEDRHGK